MAVPPSTGVPPVGPMSTRPPSFVQPVTAVRASAATDAAAAMRARRRARGHDRLERMAKGLQGCESRTVPEIDGRRLNARSGDKIKSRASFGKKSQNREGLANLL
ncbi:hypothetical protein GCM10009837_62220 [Streptomyces durmitorensis]